MCSPTFFDGALHSYCLRDGLAPDALENIFNLDQSAQGALVNVERGRIIEAQFVAHIAAALSADPDRLLKWPPFTPPTQPTTVAELERIFGSHPLRPAT